MEYSQFYEEYGHPFTGRKRRRLEEFLRRMNLSYDEGVQYTVNLVTQDGEIAATGSLQHNVIKCVAVDDRYQGEGLSSRIVTLLLNRAMETGQSHLFVFTKPQNWAMFSDLGFFIRSSRRRTSSLWRMSATESRSMCRAWSARSRKAE